MQTNSNPISAYYSPFTRAWELALGAVLAALVPQLRKVPVPAGIATAWLGLGAIALSAFIYTPQTPFPGVAALLPVLGAVAVIGGGVSGSGAGLLLNFRPIRSIGRISYGWYLLHYPLLIILAGATYTHALSALESVWIGLGTLVVAYFMYWALERPIRRSPFFGQRPWASIALGLGFVVVAFLYCFILHPNIHPLWQLWFNG